ncbi:hypothetical protein [Blastococcus sp. SYSU DS0619]
MPPVDPADAAACEMCGSPWADVDGGDTWLHLEVTRHDQGGGLDFLDADFCSQEHAARWLARPLPRPQPWAADPPAWRDRLAATGAGLAFGLLVALTMLGLWTAGRFVVGIF